MTFYWIVTSFINQIVILLLFLISAIFFFTFSLQQCQVELVNDFSIYPNNTNHENIYIFFNEYEISNFDEFIHPQTEITTAPEQPVEYMDGMVQVIDLNSYNMGLRKAGVPEYMILHGNSFLYNTLHERSYNAIDAVQCIISENGVNLHECDYFSSMLFFMHAHFFNVYIFCEIFFFHVKKNMYKVNTHEK